MWSKLWFDRNFLMMRDEVCVLEVKECAGIDCSLHFRMRFP